MREGAMETRSFGQCPICQNLETETLHSISCGNLDNSKLYPDVVINVCPQCGHIFNKLDDIALNGLTDYYNNEYAPANLGINDNTSDRPGSSGTLTSNRYDKLYETLSPYLNKNHDILDVGCAQGGFLDFLGTKGFRNLSGIDMTESYVEQARLKNKYRIELGNAESLPFNGQDFDVIVMEQVLEHLFNPIMAFREARRVLRPGGILCIGVPDASRYSDLYFFDFYWFLLREHIQHFDNIHLNYLGTLEGFEQLTCQQTVHAVMSEKMLMPNIYSVFRFNGPNNAGNEQGYNTFTLRQQIESYISQEKQKQSKKTEAIAILAKSERPVFIWGIGREFLYLYETAGLKHCRIEGLIDANPYKQRSCSVDGMKILDASVLLRNAPTDSALIITAIAHTNPIKATARSLGFKGNIFEFE